MLNWFKPKTEVVIKKVGEHSDLSDEQLRMHVDQLMTDRNWQYFEELTRRQKEKVIAQMASASEPNDMFRAQGLIKCYDWLLKLKHNLIYNS